MYIKLRTEKKEKKNVEEEKIDICHILIDLSL